LSTLRLDLVPLTPALAAAERAGTEALATALEAPIPSDWPPQFYEPDDLDRMERLLQDERNSGWTLYYLIQRAPTRAVVGVAGFSGRPSAEGLVEIGYGVVPAFRRLGFASEAVTALLEFAFRDTRVRTVQAETFPHLVGSIGVLRRTGFQPASGTGRGREGALRFHRSC
jgi:ribosomal-protein-alanine N-acetyltransferase